MRSEEGHGEAPPADTAPPAGADAEQAAAADAGVEGTVDAAAEQGTELGSAKAEGAPDAAADADADAGTDAVEGEGKTEGDAAEADKDGAAAEGDPAPYEGLEPPEGFDGIDEDALKAATPLMRAFGVPDDKAQEFINGAAPIIAQMMEKAGQAAAERQQADHAAIEKQWVDDMRAHPEFGGANYQRSLTFAAQARDKYFPPEFVQFLNESRLGQHPALFEGLVKIGKDIADDEIDVPGGAAPAGRKHPVYDPVFLPPEQR